MAIMLKVKVSAFSRIFIVLVKMPQKHKFRPNFEVYVKDYHHYAKKCTVKLLQTFFLLSTWHLLSQTSKPSYITSSKKYANTPLNVP